MIKAKRLAALLLFAAMAFALAACGGEEKTDFNIEAENCTGFAIADMRLSPESSGDWGENRLDTTLYDGELAELNLGVFGDEELESGFGIQLFDDYDNTIGVIHNTIGVIHNAYFYPGDTVTFFILDGELYYSNTGFDGSEEYEDSSGGTASETPAFKDYDPDDVPEGYTRDYDFTELAGDWSGGPDITLVFDDEGNWVFEDAFMDFHWEGYLLYHYDTDRVYSRLVGSAYNSSFDIHSDGDIVIGGVGEFWRAD